MSHTVTSEYISGAEVDILLRADGNGIIDEIVTMLEIVVVPFNDPVVKVDDIVMQTLIEDGPPILLISLIMLTTPRENTACFN